MARYDVHISNCAHDSLAMVASVSQGPSIFVCVCLECAANTTTLIRLPCDLHFINVEGINNQAHDSSEKGPRRYECHSSAGNHAQGVLRPALGYVITARFHFRPTDAHGLRIPEKAVTGVWRSKAKALMSGLRALRPTGVTKLPVRRYQAGEIAKLLSCAWCIICPLPKG